MSLSTRRSTARTIEGFKSVAQFLGDVVDASARLPLFDALKAASPWLEAIGSSLVSVTAFGATTAANYAFSGLVDWRVASLFLIGGAVGGLLGGRVAIRLSAQKAALARMFAVFVGGVGAYVALRGLVNVL